MIWLEIEQQVPLLILEHLCRVFPISCQTVPHLCDSRTTLACPSNR